MPKINLFPPEIQQRQRRRKILHLLAAAQVAVILLLLGAVFILQAVERQARGHSTQLATQLAEADRAPMEAAEALRAMEDRGLLVNQILDTHMSDIFNPEWLIAVLEATPPTVRLLSFDFTGEAIVLTAIANDLPDIGTHQRQLNNAETFESVLLGQVERLEDEGVRYQLRLIVTP
jgi:Tfp pilus assembly protein PilN